MRTVTMITVAVLLAAPPARAQVQALLESADPSLSSNPLTAKQEAATSLLLLGAYAAGTMDAAAEVTIDGTFEGWDGETRVELTDGAVLRQSSYEWSWCWAFRPKALLSCGIGGCELRVDDSSCPEAVRVEVISAGQNFSLHRYRRFFDRVRRLSETDRDRLFDLMRRTYP